MPQTRCPRCNKFVTTDFDNTDFVHECDSGNPVLDQEDIVVNGTKSTEFGKEVDTGRKQGEVMFQGAVNKFFGTAPGMEGEDFNGVTRRGNDDATNRQRQHYEYMKIGGKLK